MAYFDEREPRIMIGDVRTLCMLWFVGGIVVGVVISIMSIA